MPDTSLRAARAPIAITVQLADDRSRSVMSTQGEDISITGLFVRCSEPYTVGTTVRVSLPLEEALPVETVGRVVRVGPGASGQIGMGIMFTALDERSREAVAQLVAARLERMR